jgi:ribonuclease HI
MEYVNVRLAPKDIEDSLGGMAIWIVSGHSGETIAATVTEEAANHVAEQYEAACVAVVEAAKVIGKDSQEVVTAIQDHLLPRKPDQFWDF